MFPFAETSTIDSILTSLIYFYKPLYVDSMLRKPTGSPSKSKVLKVCELAGMRGTLSEINDP